MERARLLREIDQLPDTLRVQQVEDFIQSLAISLVAHGEMPRVAYELAESWVE